MKTLVILLILIISSYGYTIDAGLKKQYETYIDNFYKENQNGPGSYILSTATDDDSKTITVSEAIGYGMLITAHMNDKDRYDELYAFFKKYQQPNKLMQWEVYDDGTADSGSATDGDLDIAYSLLIASEKWGNKYKDEAVEMIDAIWENEMFTDAEDIVPACGDTWEEEAEYNKSSYTRPSDWMPGHFRAFSLVSDYNWDAAVDGVYNFNKKYRNSSTGLVPDFFKGFKPGPANGIETKHDGDYYYNACRVPLRFAMDRGSSRGGEAKEKIYSFFDRKYNGDMFEIKAGYSLSGDEIKKYNEWSFISPVISAGYFDQDEWDELSTIDQEEAFSAAINILSMLVVSNKWIVPTPKLSISTLQKKHSIKYTLKNKTLTLYQEAKTIRIYNLHGALIYSKNISNPVINLTFLVPGRYLCKIDKYVLKLNISK